MSWFKKWFNSPLYEKLYANRNESEAKLLADLIEKKVPKSTHSKLLDLGCGRGRHSITFAGRGYQVKGIDLSEAAITTAKKRAHQNKASHARFEIRDMREPLNETFDAILNLFTTFGYFLDDNENQRILKSAGCMLRKDGIFVIDFLNANQVKINLKPCDNGIYESLEYSIERYIEDGMVHKTITFTGPELEEPVEYTERVKLYDKSWFEKNLSETGFEISCICGDYYGNDFDEQSSPRLLMFNRKL